jgi:hypothetical protein
MAETKNLPIASFDIICESQHSVHMLVVVFAQSASPAYALAVEFARGAVNYGEVALGKKFSHAAAFGRAREQAARASALLKIVVRWKGTQVFTSAGGADPYHIIDVLDCYQQSLSVSEPKAHCHVVHMDVYRTKETYYMVPCRHLQGWFHSIIEEQNFHPSKLPDRTEALAVRKGCSWCPHFSPAEARTLPAAEKGAVSSTSLNPNPQSNLKIQ